MLETVATHLRDHLFQLTLEIHSGHLKSIVLPDPLITELFLLIHLYPASEIAPFSPLRPLSSPHIIVLSRDSQGILSDIFVIC